MEHFGAILNGYMMNIFGDFESKDCSKNKFNQIFHTDSEIDSDYHIELMNFTTRLSKIHKERATIIFYRLGHR